MLRSISRLIDQTLAALSAAMVVPRWRIGFLIGPLHIRHEQTTRTNRYVDKSTWCDGYHLPTTFGRQGAACVRYFRQNQDRVCEREINATNTSLALSGLMGCF